MRKNPLFTAFAAASLAIGIGATTTIFSLGSALLLRPAPGVVEPNRVVDVGRTQAGNGFDTVSYPNYRDLRSRTATLSGLYAYEIEPRAMSLGGRGDAQRVYGTVVTGNYFGVLGTRPQLGRMLQEADDGPGAQLVAVISHELWRRYFEAAANATEQTILLNGHSFAVVGVAPPGFQGTTMLKADVWVPISALAQAMPRTGSDILTDRAGVWLMMGGRLKPGVTVGRANTEFEALGATLEREFPAANGGKSYRVAPWARFPGRVNVVAGFIALLMVIVGLVLLIACVNVAGMLLARAAGRQREIAIRLAIGAGRTRLIRQLLTETATLFLLGGAAGLTLTRWFTALLLMLVPRIPFPVAVEIRTDWRVVAFTVAISLAAAILSGLAPALQASRADLATALKSGMREGGLARLRLRNAVVVGQITMSLLLVIVAGLFLRALQHEAAIYPGFEEAGVDVVSLDLSLAGYTDTSGQQFLREVLIRAQSLPAVQAASAAMDLPLDGSRMGIGGLKVPGLEPPPGMSSFPADANIVEPGFFGTLKMPLLRGRDFTATDTKKTPAVAIVNEAMARRFWPDQNPIGKRMELADNPNGSGTVLTVVGLASDAKLMSLNEDAEPYFYVPLAQHYQSRISLLARSNGTRSLIPQIRQVIREMNANLPLTEAMPLSEVTALAMVPQRLAVAVAGSLGIVGLLLAGIGIYGATAYAVSRRTREIAIRIALGADKLGVTRLVLRHGLWLAATGIGSGIAIAAATTRLLQGFLVGVRALDTVTFSCAALLFGLITLAASYVPARRAARVDPMVALRNE